MQKQNSNFELTKNENNTQKNTPDGKVRTGNAFCDKFIEF